MSSPAAHSSRSGSVTRNALQRASAATSPEPWETAGSTVDPSGLRLAGRNRVSPVFWLTGFARRALSNGSAGLGDPLHFLDGGARDGLESNHGGPRVARKAEEVLALCLAENQRLPGLYRHAIEKELRSQLGQNLFDHVVLARRDAAR